MRVFALIFAAVLAISHVASSATIGLPMLENLERLSKNPMLVRAFEKEIREMINCVQKVLQDGLPEHGLPSLNPLDVDALNLDLTSLNIPGIAGSLALKNVHLAGAVNWDITKLKVTVTIIPVGANVEVALNWGSVAGNVEYDGDLTLGDYHVFGAGNADFDVTDFNIAVTAKVTIGPLKIKSLSIKPALGSLRAKITGLFNDEALSEELSNNITNNASNWLNENAAAIDKQLSEAIMNLVNNSTPGDPKPPGEETIIDIILGMCTA